MSKKLYGLIGFPLGHSRSADYFNQRFRSEGPEGSRYQLFPIPAVQGIVHLLEEHPDLAGLNVTIPYKEKIMPYLTALDDLAAQIGSVNVILIQSSGGLRRLKGFNTDAQAFIHTLPEPDRHRNALILGTGGAAKAVAYALNQTGIKSLFVSRHSSSPDTIGYDQLHRDPEIMAEHTLIVNATPSGMFPETDACPDIPYDRLDERYLLYDLVYNPDRTLFLQQGASKGAQIQSGEAMFVKQAELSFNLFTSIP